MNTKNDKNDLTYDDVCPDMYVRILSLPQDNFDEDFEKIRQTSINRVCRVHRIDKSYLKPEIEKYGPIVVYYTILEHDAVGQVEFRVRVTDIEITRPTEELLLLYSSDLPSVVVIEETGEVDKNNPTFVKLVKTFGIVDIPKKSWLR